MSITIRLQENLTLLKNPQLSSVFHPQAPLHTNEGKHCNILTAEMATRKLSLRGKPAEDTDDTGIGSYMNSI